MGGIVKCYGIVTLLYTVWEVRSLVASPCRLDQLSVGRARCRGLNVVYCTLSIKVFNLLYYKRTMSTSNSPNLRQSPNLRRCTRPYNVFTLFTRRHRDLQQHTRNDDTLALLISLAVLQFRDACQQRDRDVLGRCPSSMVAVNVSLGTALLVARSLRPRSRYTRPTLPLHNHNSQVTVIPLLPYK